MIDKRSKENLVSSPHLVESRIESLKSLVRLLMIEIDSFDPNRQPSGILERRDRISLSNEVRRFEIEMIREALIRSKGLQVKAAMILGTKVTTLNGKIRRYGIELQGFSDSRD